MPLRIVFISLCFAFQAAAQETPAKVSASFYSFATVPEHPSVTVPSAAGAFEEVRLSTANIVGPFSCVITNGKITIHSVKTEELNGTVSRPVIASGIIRPDLKRALVVLFPAAAGAAEKYRCLVFNHDLSDFPLGVYRLINISNKPVRGAVGREVVKAEPGGIANLEMEGNPGQILPVRFEFFENERWNLLTETRAAVRKDRRWLMCIYQDPSTGRMNIRSIPDRTRHNPAENPQPAESGAASGSP